MIKLEHIETFNWEGAIRGMRNPMNSWDKSDSCLCEGGDNFRDCIVSTGVCPRNGDFDRDRFCIGAADFDLMKRLAKAGSDHRKYMRQIFVSVDITAPLYWWKEFDTYKVGTVANSCSTMHTIHKKEFEVSDFSTDNMTNAGTAVLNYLISVLEDCRECFNETKDKGVWHDLISLLPSGYLQKRTVTMTYENLVNMYHARKNHKLDEWHTFCGWIKCLPYSEIITGVKE